MGAPSEQGGGGARPHLGAGSLPNEFRRGTTPWNRAEDEALLFWFGKMSHRSLAAKHQRTVPAVRKRYFDLVDAAIAQDQAQQRRGDGGREPNVRAG